MFYVKIHKVAGDIMLAVCDRDIIGEIYEEDELRLEVKKEFYAGEIMGEQDLLEHLSNATIANIVGNNAVDVAVNNGLVNEDNVLTVSGVKHAQIVVML